MSGQALALFVSVFLACSVEAVEALTIVLAIGIARGWRSAFAGLAAALAVLAVVVAALGPALVALPIDVLRVAVGGLLLVFGLQWLRKAILRAAGLKATRDETLAFSQEIDAAREIGLAHTTSDGRRDSVDGSGGIDGYGFAVVFKGALLEGLEVAFIVLTFGANQHRVALAGAAAALAVALVTLVGFLARAPLARVPENAMKFAVGVMLCSFGMFWGAEGAGASWPGSDGALLVIIPSLLLASLAMVSVLRRRAPDFGARADLSAGAADPPVGADVGAGAERA